MKKILFVGVLVAFMSLVSVTQAHVLDGAKEWSGHYYKIISMKMEWEEAKKFCESMGGHLATAETSAENEMLKELILNSNNPGYSYLYLIGGNNKNNIWRWITGKPIVDYFDWSSRGLEYYEYLCFYKEKSEYKWTTTYRTDKQAFICEWESKELAHDSTM